VDVQAHSVIDWHKEYEDKARERFSGRNGYPAFESFERWVFFEARNAPKQTSLTGADLAALLRRTDFGSMREVFSLEERMTEPPMGPINLGHFDVRGKQHRLRLLPCFSVIHGDHDEANLRDTRDDFIPNRILARFNAIMQRGRRKQAISDDTDEGYDEPGEFGKIFQPEEELRVFCQIGAVEVETGEHQWLDTNFVLVLSLTNGFQNPFLIYNWKQREDPHDPDCEVEDVRAEKEEKEVRDGARLIPDSNMLPFVYCRVLTTLEELLDTNERPAIELHNRQQYGNYVLVSARRNPSGVVMRPGEYPEPAKIG